MGPTLYTRFLIAFKLIIHICFQIHLLSLVVPEGTGGFFEIFWPGDQSQRLRLEAPFTFPAKMRHLDAWVLMKVFVFLVLKFLKLSSRDQVGC